jgi:hypothetical protein
MPTYSPYPQLRTTNGTSVREMDIVLFSYPVEASTDSACTDHQLHLGLVLKHSVSLTKQISYTDLLIFQTDHRFDPEQKYSIVDEDIISFLGNYLPPSLVVLPADSLENNSLLYEVFPALPGLLELRRDMIESGNV